MSQSEEIRTIRGVKDVLPKDQAKWRYAIKEFETLADIFGFYKINIPAIEYLDLFDRSIGTETDIVSKELFVVNQKSGTTDKLMALRPEFTAGIVRAYNQNGLKQLPQPLRLYTYGPVFRYDRPQKGRYREHNQLDMEILGTNSAADDAWVIYLGWTLLKRLGIENVVVQINSLGSKTNQQEYIKKLHKYFAPHKKELSETDQRRLELNPMRILDSKDEGIKKLIEDAPQSIDHLDKESKEFFFNLLSYLDDYKVTYNLNPQIVRGLDYYTHTAFEFTCENSSGQQDSIGGGGRYDGLSELIGGGKTGGVGMGIGLERVIQLLKNKPPAEFDSKGQTEIFIIHLSKRGRKKAQDILEQLHEANFATLHAPDRPSLRAQLKKADRLKAKYSVIIGETEAKGNNCILRDMKSGIQEDIQYSDLLSTLTDRLRNGRSARHVRNA